MIASFSCDTTFVSILLIFSLMDLDLDFVKMET